MVGGSMPVEMPSWMGSTSNWGRRGGKSVGREFSGSQDQKHSLPWSWLSSPYATWLPPASCPPPPLRLVFFTDPTVSNSSSRHFFVPTCALLCYNSSEHLTTNYFKISRLSFIVLQLLLAMELQFHQKSIHEQFLCWVTLTFRAVWVRCY